MPKPYSAKAEEKNQPLEIELGHYEEVTVDPCWNRALLQLSVLSK